MLVAQFARIGSVIIKLNHIADVPTDHPQICISYIDEGYLWLGPFGVYDIIKARVPCRRGYLDDVLYIW